MYLVAEWLMQPVPTPGVGGSNLCVEIFFFPICFYLYFTASKSILSQLFRQSAGYVLIFVLFINFFETGFG